MVKKKINKKEKALKDMSFQELLEANPDVAQILMNRGMHCIGCPMAMEETLEQGALAHGINPDELANEINKKEKKKKVKK